MIYHFLQVQDTETTSVITIPESKQTHTGRFIISAENAAGHKNVKVRVAVVGKYNLFLHRYFQIFLFDQMLDRSFYRCADLPGKIRDLKVSDVTRGTCRLSWKPPANDGGDRIKSYFIEKKTVEGKAWTKVNPACASLSTVVPDLSVGQDYLFRIRAENSVGLGPYYVTIQRTTARDPIRK